MQSLQKMKQEIPKHADTLIKKYKHVIFDFDGTISDTQKAIAYSIAKTYSHFDQPQPDSCKIASSVSLGIGMEDTFKFLTPTIFLNESNIINEWITIYRRIYNEEGHKYALLFDGVSTIIPLLADAGIQLTVVSNKGEKAIEDALNKFAIRQYVSLVVGDQEGIKKKPHPMIFEEIIKPTFNLKLNNVLMVGDTLADIQFAINSGIHSCWAAYGYGEKEKCALSSPTYTIQSFIELHDIVIKQQ